jgi:hypothetical protein
VVKIKIKIKSRVLKRKLKAIKHLKILLMWTKDHCVKNPDGSVN